MLRLRYLIAALVAICLSGCGGDSLSLNDTGPEPPHGGMMYRFSKGPGFVEIVQKSGPSPITAELTFYFYQNADTPMEPTPESAVLVLDKRRKITLEAEGDTLVTPTGPALFPGKEIDGTLLVTIDGESRSVPIGVR